MKTSRNNYGHRRGPPNDFDQLRKQTLTSRNSVKFRNSVATNYQLELDCNQLHNYKNRFSFNMLENRRVPKFDDYQHQQAQNTLINLKNTLNQLQSKIESAKQSLQANNILGKTIILQVEEDEDSKIIDLNSFNQSNFSKISHHIQDSIINLDNHKRLISSINSNQLIDLSKVKTYYRSQIAAAIMGNNDRALIHLAYSWQVISRSNLLPRPTLPQIQQRKVNLLCHERDIFKKTIILDLDQTLVHCQWERKSPEDIDICFVQDSGQRKIAYLSIRPHAISFLKKNSRKFQIIIFTERPKSQADVILDQMDPDKQYIRHRLYKGSCIQLQNGVWVKDMKILNRDLKNVVIVDDMPYSYINQLDNAVPILPYTSGSDGQLYALEKLLEDVSRCEDVRVFNRRNFQLKRYGEFGEAIQAAKCLYFKKE